MESSTPLSSSSSGNNNNNNNSNTIAQDPLALSSESSSLYSSNNSGENSNSQDRQQQQQHELCGNLSATQSNNNLSDKENSLNENGAIYANDITIKHEDANSLADDRRLQYDSNQIANNYNSSNDPRKQLNHMGMHQQHLTSHEPHKTFSHSIENLSKTTEKCTPNEIKMYPNLIDSGHEYDDGYETGVGDLMSHKYKLPTLPPPSSSPYSSLSSSSMSTISTSTMTPTNLVNPQQQQSPSYMSGGSGANGNTGNTMNHYQQQQQQQQYLQSQQQQYQSMQQHQNHMNSFNNYHPMFGNRAMQHQAMSNVIKNETSMTSVDNDPYRFVDDDLSNGMNSASGIHSAMHQNYQHMTSPTVMSGNYPTPNMIQQQQNSTTGNASMMQFTEHHHMSPHHHHQLSHSHPQQIQSQHNMMNGNANAQNIGHAGMNPNMMMMNDTPKKRGRKKKLRDENGNPIEDRPVKERKKHDRFNGMPEEEVTKRTIPDHIANNLDIIIIGINPGLFAAYKGHHYAGPGNHFWKCLYLSGLTSVQMTAEEDFKLMQYGIGFTNMVQRPTKGSADLTRKEIKEGSRILLEKLQKYQPKIAVFNGKLIFEVFSGKKDFCFGKQPETVEGTNTYMWVMPSSSARCAQLPRAADKVPFYGALKKFRDYLNGLIPEYDETEYVFNDPKYSQISTEAELKDDAHAFTTLENGEVIIGDPNKKKRGRPKKVRGENGEEIVTPSRRNKNNNNNNNENQNSDCIDDDPNKKKRGRPKKVKDGTNSSPSAAKKKSNSNKDKALQQQQSISSPMSGGGNDLSSLSHHQPSPSSQNPQLSSLSNHGNNSNTASSNSQTSFLPPIESPTASLNFQNNGAINQQTIVQQSNNLQTQPMSSPVNLCYPPAATATSMEQSELSQHNHVTYQQQRSQIFSNNASPELTGEITTNNINDQITSPVASASPNLTPSDFEPPEPTVNPTQNTNELTHYSQQTAAQSLEQQHHHTHSPLSQSHSPLGLSGLYPHAQSQQQQQQQSMSQMMNSVNNSSIYSPYSRQQSTPQQSYMSMSQSPHHPQTPTQNIAPNNKPPQQQQQQQQQIGQQINGSTTDLFKDVAAKSLSGLESLVDQIPNINEQDTGLSALSSGTQNVQLQTNEFNMISGYSSSGSTVATNLTSASSTLGSSSLLPPTLPHHHSHYTTYTSHANQSPYSASPFSVSSLTSSTYPSAAAMNNYHQNLMGTSHLTSSFMEPHMPVPVSPLYHSYQQQGYPGYGGPPHPSAAAALHMSNYPYYTNMNTGYTQAPGSTYHSMFDRINF